MYLSLASERLRGDALIEKLQNLEDLTLFTPAWAHMALGRQHDPQKQNGLQNRLTKPSNKTVLQKKEVRSKKGKQFFRIARLFLGEMQKTHGKVAKSSDSEKVFSHIIFTHHLEMIVFRVKMHCTLAYQDLKIR